MFFSFKINVFASEVKAAGVDLLRIFLCFNCSNLKDIWNESHILQIFVILFHSASIL